MTRGYDSEQIREKLIDALSQSKIGLTGIEIAEKLHVNRVTMAKYLKVFAAESLIKQKTIGSVNLWFIEKGVDQLSFPQDLFQVKNRYLDYILSASVQEAHNLIRTSLHSGANPSKLVTEAIVPAVEAVDNSYKSGKIGKSEKNYLDEVISSSLHLVRISEREVNPKKNVVILSTDYQNAMLGLCASAAYQAQEWRVSLLGDMSSAIDVMFDIDLQRFLNKVWPKREGIMVIAIFSSEEGPTKFFSQAVDASRGKFGRNLHLAVYNKTGKKYKTGADFVSDDLEKLLQWSDTVFESSKNQ
ncbi:MAG TPA: ArsR family transcriptional regulator [Candidatus Nitrosotalea sp.]|nr:ArsR family transcriptional regulator [Candidatus Nitrosotalea sp.]